MRSECLECFTWIKKKQNERGRRHENACKITERKNGNTARATVNKNNTTAAVAAEFSVRILSLLLALHLCMFLYYGQWSHC